MIVKRFMFNEVEVEIYHHEDNTDIHFWDTSMGEWQRVVPTLNKNQLREFIQALQKGLKDEN